MATLPVSHVTLAGDREARPSRLSAMAAWGVDFFVILGAARRVASAVETGQAPHKADLRTLGINRDLPRLR